MKQKIQNSKLKIQKAPISSSQIILTFAFCFLSLWGCGNLSRVRYGQEAVKMAVLPAYSLERMTERYLPLLRHLSSETGYDVQYVSSSSYGGFGATAQGSDVHFVLCDPLSLLTLQKTGRAEALAVCLGAGGAGQSPGLIVVRNGGLNEIKQLKGKRVGIASQRSAEGFLSQAYTLMEQGIDVRRDLRLVPCGNMDEVMEKLKAGRIDAGFIGLPAWDEAAASHLCILARTESVPNWAVASLPGTTPEVRNKIQNALLAMGPQNEGQRKILERMRLEGFSQPDLRNLENLSRMAARAGIPF
jgi:ABC-type phosphate/phosphonate transport system substrate-binding protein